MTPTPGTPKIACAVVGASGFMGSELVRLLLGHPHVDLAYLAGHSTAGKQLSEVRPGFLGTDLPVGPVDLPAIADKAEVVFLALPHGESAAVAGPLLEKGKTIIDLGSDFRLKSPAEVKKYYNREAPPQHLLDQAVYCLPELTGAPPVGTKLVSCPGCFATALSLTLAPLLPDHSGQTNNPVPVVNVFGITGSSGSGITPAPGVHHSLRSTNFTAYKPLKHQHEGEVKQLLASPALRRSGSFNFIPHSAPVPRGIHLTAIIDRNDARPTTPGSLAQFYKDKPFVTVTEGPVALGSVVHTNRAVIGITETDQTLAVFCAIDNLLKGGSGQAVQIFNLLHNFPEPTALPQIAPWP